MLTVLMTWLLQRPPAPFPLPDRHPDPEPPTQLGKAQLSPLATYDVQALQTLLTGEAGVLEDLLAGPTGVLEDLIAEELALYEPHPPALELEAEAGPTGVEDELDGSHASHVPVLSLMLALAEAVQELFEKRPLDNAVVLHLELVQVPKPARACPLKPSATTVVAVNFILT